MLDENGARSYAEIPLTRGLVALVDVADYEWLSKTKWRAAASSPGVIYAGTSTGPRGHTTLLMHRVILDAPRGLQVDHINGDRLDNRRANIRICTHAQNRRNVGRRKSNTSGFKGVSLNRALGRWVASIGFDRRRLHLGVFDTPEAAARAYDAAARERHGEFAHLNFPEAA